jgi:hypothetical protein
MIAAGTTLDQTVNQRAYPRERRAVQRCDHEGPGTEGPLGSGALKVVTAYYSFVTGVVSLN